MGWALSGVSAVATASDDHQWKMFNISLAPNASTRCADFPYDTAPLHCTLSRSQAKFLPSETGSCSVCGGTLVVSISDQPGARVLLDQVFLEPGDWGRYKGLHMHRAPVETLLAMGIRMVRYGKKFEDI